MKILLLISCLLTITVAQESPLVCSYSIYFDTYRCDLTINNPNGWNNFTEIGGIHLEGFTNADVEVVTKAIGFTTNVPRIICDTFPNLLRMVLLEAYVTEIGDGDFDSCSRLAQLELAYNRITTISENAFAGFPNIRFINLDGNSISSLPENVFAGLENLTDLHLSYNIFTTDLPVNLFRPLVNLQLLRLEFGNILAFNNQWFAANTRLNYLFLLGNRISLEPDSFVGLDALVTLNLGFNGISEIPDGAFEGLSNLRNLFLHDNLFNELQADAFADLGGLNYLDLGYNQIEVIEDGAFRGLDNLTILYMPTCGLRRLRSHFFENLENVNVLNLNFNQIEDIEPGTFAPLSNINYIGLWRNRVKTLRRNAFGSLTSLIDLDLDGNIVNALDINVILDAVNMNSLWFSGNLCASGYFGNFLISRDQYMPILERCFANMRYIIDTVTEGDNQFSFFEGLNPGIVFRVNSENEVQIALTPFNFVWNPVIEIIIGTANNTRSAIRMNQETNVVTVPTPNIIRPDQWNDFRISWANQVVLVYSGNDSFPFMTYTMQHIFPVNFYGLRAVETRATWSVQPLD